MVHRLHAHEIIRTIEGLHARINEQFPGSDILQLCDDLKETAHLTENRLKHVARPHVLLRSIQYMLIAAFLLGAVALGNYLDVGDWFRLEADDRADLTVALESAVNLTILAGGALWFFIHLESRIRRRTVLTYLYEMRAFAHAVDMYQLSRNVSTILCDRSPVTPACEPTPAEAVHHLDYCTEMLSLTGKLAALHSQVAVDAEITSAASDVELLTTGLTRKIWQKVGILAQMRKTASP